MPIVSKPEEPEVRDLIPWIAESVDALNKTLNLEIEIEGKEVYEKNIRLDLVGTDHFSQMVAIIEVQAGESDHWHLGKLIMYAANREAGIIIWIAHKFDETHRHTIDWLNTISPAEMSFYGVELEIGKDDESLLAPNFQVIAEPPASKRPAIVSGEISPENKQYLKFFEKVRDKILSQRFDFTTAKALPQSWWFVGVGRPGFTIGSCFTVDDKFRVEIHVDMGIKEYNKEAFNQLKKMKYKLEQEIGKELTWEDLPDSRAFRIYVATDAAIDDDDQKLNKTIDWTVPMIIKFREVFGPLIKEIKFKE